MQIATYQLSSIRIRCPIFSDCCNVVAKRMEFVCIEVHDFVTPGITFWLQRSRSMLVSSRGSLLLCTSRDNTLGGNDNRALNAGIDFRRGGPWCTARSLVSGRSNERLWTSDSLRESLRRNGCLKIRIPGRTLCSDSLSLASDTGVVFSLELPSSECGTCFVTKFTQLVPERFSYGV